MQLESLFTDMLKGNIRALAKLITAAENRNPAMVPILEKLELKPEVPVIGITGPPGAGKSSLVNALVHEWTQNQDLKVAIIAVDPSSPFNMGALLGDRLRMSDHFTHQNIFIRSMATRGALGGLSSQIVETTDLLKNAGYNRIIIETVGVGQSEIDIAGLADTTLLVLVPEAGDEVQAIKSGIMEIAHIFVVNKADRDGANAFVKNLKNALHHRNFNGWQPPVLKTIATQKVGIQELSKQIEKHTLLNHQNIHNKALLLAEKAYKILAAQKMEGINKQDWVDMIKKELINQNFNLYSFVKSQNL